MNKTFIRFLMFFVVLGYGFLLLVEVSDYGSEIIRLQNNHLWMKVFLVILGSMSAISTFIMWGLMLYHWGTHVFKGKIYKLLWFLSMSIGMFIGAWFYYIVVFELGKTVRESKNIKS